MEHGSEADPEGEEKAPYTKKNKISATDTSLYRQINNSIVSHHNGDSLAAFIKYYFSGSQFKTDLANVIGNRNLSDDLANVYAGDTLLKYDNEFAQDIFQNYCTYYSSGDSERATLRSLIWTNMSVQVMDMIDMPCFNMNDLITSVLGYDNTVNTTLNNLATLDINRFNTLYQFLVGTPPPPLMTTAAKITAIRGYPDGVVANNINNLFTPAELETIIENLSGTIQSNVFTNMDPCTLFSAIGNCGYGTAWYNFVRDYMNETEVKNIISQGTEKFYLAGKLIEKDPKVLNKIVSLNRDLISDVLRNTSGLDLITYLNYIYQRFGRTTFNNVLDDIGTGIKIQKTLTLEELHIYGSSRHGINKPKKLVVRKSYVLEAIQSDGVFTYSSATDSTIAKISTKTFKRTLSFKQYELTNHLGNVLATVLDRKTAITNADTLLYYDADVSTAGMYYAFGSTMSDLSYVHDTGKYRYGFNNKETDSETDLQDYGHRIYNPRLGKFLSIDPLTNKYPELTPYQFASNCPISGVDLDGLEYYYAADGTYLGHVKGSSEIRVINSIYLLFATIERVKQTILITDAGFENQEGTALRWIWSTSVIDADMKTAGNVYKSIYAKSFKDNAAKDVIAEDEVNYQGGETTSDEVIEMNVSFLQDKKNKKTQGSNNYYDVLCIMIHENEHAKIGENGENVFLHFKHTQLYIASDYYKNTSEKFKEWTGDWLRSYLHEQYNELSTLFSKANNENLSKEEREEAQRSYDYYNKIYLENINYYENTTGRKYSIKIN
jgi:RHS repeat-associated protein